MDDAEQSGVTGSTAGDSGCVDIPHMCAKSELSDIWRIRGFLGTEELFEEASPEAKAEQEINLDSLTAYLHTKMPDRIHTEPSTISELVDELLKAG